MRQAASPGGPLAGVSGPVRQPRARVCTRESATLTKKSRDPVSSRSDDAPEDTRSNETSPIASPDLADDSAPDESPLVGGLTSAETDGSAVDQVWLDAGPTAWRNWQGYLHGAELNSRFETALYSDAVRFTPDGGHLDSGIHRLMLFQAVLIGGLARGAVLA